MGPCRSGLGSRPHSPAAVVASICGVPPSMPLLPSWPPRVSPRHWWGRCLGMIQVPPPTPAPPWLPSLLLHLVLTGSVWMRLTCLYTSTPFLSSLMRPSINISYHLLPPPGSSSALPHAGDWLNGVPSTAQSAALAPAKEMPNLIADSLSRPVDVYLPTWSRGLPAALDVHVISPLQQQSLGEAASIPGLALQVGVQCKLTTHLAECQSAGVDFVPIVVEALGGSC